jgi:SAM-dependent methyltransferase
MRRDVLELRAFYAGPLGAAARDLVSRKVVEAWGGLSGLDVLAFGYATPFLAGVAGEARRVLAAMPAEQGVETWPAGGRNCATLVVEAALPFPNALFDRILAVHALEESDAALETVRELGRVLGPSGRLILVVAARLGLWANAEDTPLGHGRPYSRRQLETLVREADLEPAGWTRALYLPPFAWAARFAEGFEQAGARLCPPLAGLILMEAVKLTPSLRPIPARRPARVFAPGALRPA